VLFSEHSVESPTTKKKVRQEAKLSLGQPTVLPHSTLVISDCC